MDLMAAAVPQTLRTAYPDLYAVHDLSSEPVYKMVGL